MTLAKNNSHAAKMSRLSHIGNNIILNFNVITFLAIGFGLTNLPAPSSALATPLTIKNQARENLKAGKSQEALDLLNKNSSQSNTDSQYFFLKGRALQDLRRNTESLSNYSIAIFLNPKFTNALINRGLVKGALQDINGALGDLDQALILEPKNLAALVNRGVTYGGLNKPLLAITDFDRVIQIDPNYADAFRNRGLTKHLIGDKKGACDDWSKSKDLGIVDAAEWLAKLCR